MSNNGTDTAKAGTEKKFTVPKPPPSRRRARSDDDMSSATDTTPASETPAPAEEPPAAVPVSAAAPPTAPPADQLAIATPASTRPEAPESPSTGAEAPAREVPSTNLPAIATPATPGTGVGEFLPGGPHGGGAAYGAGGTPLGGFLPPPPPSEPLPMKQPRTAVVGLRVSEADVDWWKRTTVTLAAQYSLPEGLIPRIAFGVIKEHFHDIVRKAVLHVHGVDIGPQPPSAQG